jgi:hypothetical protein
MFTGLTGELENAVLLPFLRMSHYLPVPDYNSSVFINCPFDDQFKPLLEAIMFCVVFAGLRPRLALEAQDSGETRFQKIIRLIQESRFAIHDLSRAQAKNKGEFFRLNMPFELGLDYGCRFFGSREYSDKRALILEEKPYRYQASLSDLAGVDIKQHKGSYEGAIEAVRSWLVSEVGVVLSGASAIISRYADFQSWHLEREAELRQSTPEDIKAYPVPELLEAMREWCALGQGKLI